MAEQATTQSALEVRDLSRTFGARKALDKVTFDLPRGAFLSIFGPNGAGKTTMLKVLSTLTPPSSGKASVMGLDVVEDAVELRERIGFISHNPLLYPDLTAEENLEFFADLYCIADPKTRVKELLSAVELDHRRLDAVRTFSRGMIQRLSIARALLHKPDVLFLDEPYSGLDPHAMDILDSLIAQVRAEHTFVMISHDLQKGLELCSHALILAKGKIVLLEEREAIDPDAFAATYRATVGMGVSKPMAEKNQSAHISGLRQFKAILKKDIVMELRTKEMLTSMGLYALLVLLIYYIALSQAGQSFDVTNIAGGLLWLAIVFTSLLGLNRSLVHEKDQGCLDALLLAPVDRPVIFFGKAIGNLLFLLLVELFVTPLFMFIFNAGKYAHGASTWGYLSLILVVGSIGIAGVGTLLATMSVNTTGKDFVLAVLFIPVMFPLLLAVVAATWAILNASPDLAVYWKMLGVAAGYDGIMLLAAYALYEFVLGA